jgi:plasmid stability protein
MYTSALRRILIAVKRLQIHIDEDMDHALEVRAAREGTSKAALIREFVAERLDEGHEPDPLDELVGSVDADSADVDDVVYGS